MSRVRLGVIGAGMAFEPHARSLLDLAQEVEVAAVVAPSAATREKVARSHGFPVAASPDILWRDPDVEAVLILTPPHAHFALAEAAVRAGKHILIEKPLDASTRNAERLVALCEQHRLLLGVVLQHRFRESAIRLREMLDSGALGEIVSISVQVPWWRPQSYYDVPGRGSLARDGGGVLLTQAIHTIDLALSLAGPVRKVFARAVTSTVHRMETEDLVAATFVCEGGAIGSLHATTACYPGHPEQIRIMGTKGSACMEGDSLQARLLDGSSIDCGSPAALGAGADPMAFPHQQHLALLRAFLAAVRTGVPLAVDGRAALRVQHFIDAMLRSSATGREIDLAS